MGCINQRAVNVVVEPLDTLLGEQHTGCLTADNSSDLAGQYVELSDTLVDYYLLFDDGVASDPEPAGRTAIVVDYDSADTNSGLADDIVDAINGVSGPNDLVAKKVIDNGVVKVLIVSVELGVVLSAWDVGTAISLDLEIERTGSKLDMGLIEGEISLAIEEEFVDVTAAQFGPELLNQIRTANNFTLSITYKEATQAKIAEVMSFSASKYTPTGGNEVVGYGALAGSKQFQSAIADSKVLIMHPTRLAVTDRSSDYAFWRAYPVISDITHSGEETKSFTVDFNFYLDESKQNPVNKMVYGDWKQDFINEI